MKKSCFFRAVLALGLPLFLTPQGLAKTYTVSLTSATTNTAVINANTTAITGSSFASPYKISASAGNKTLTAIALTDFFVLSAGSFSPTLQIIDNNTANVTIAVPFSLTGSGAKLILSPSASRTMTFSSLFTSNGSAIEITGPGTIDFSADSSATFQSGSTLKVTGGALKVSGNLAANIDLRASSSGMVITGGLSSPLLQNGKSVEINKSSGTTTIATALQNGSQPGEVGTLSINSGPDSPSGTVWLTGVNTYTGATTVTAGTLKLGSSASTSGNFIVAGTLEIANTSDSTYPGVFSGPGIVSNTSTQRITLSGAPTFTGSLKTSAGTLQLGDSWVVAKPDLGISYGGTSTLEIVSTTGSSLSPTVYSGSISKAAEFSGTASFIKLGTGVLELASSTQQIDSYQVSSGTLILNTTPLPSVGVVVSSDAALELKTDPASPKTYSGVISGSGSVALSGLGDLTLSASQSYTGPTTLRGGTLSYGVSQALSHSTAVSISSGATLSLGEFSGTVASLSGSGSLSLNAGTLTHGNTDNTEFSGSISGSGSIIKQGSGTWTLSGSRSSYNGSTQIAQGTLKLGHELALGQGSVSIAPSSSLDLNGQSPSNSITLDGGTLLNSSAQTALASGSLALSRDAAISATDGNILFSGPISGASSLSLTGTSSQSITTSGTCKLNGDYTVSNVDVFHTGTVVAFPGKSYNILSGSSTLSGTLGLAGSTYSINSDTLTLNSATLRLDDRSVSSLATISGTGSLSLAGSVTASISFGRTMHLALPLLGSGSFIKIDSGTLKLSGSSMYEGPTSIRGGRLILTDSAASCSSAAIAMARYSDLEFAASSTTTVSRPISGDGNVTKSSPGSLTLSGLMTYTGNTIVSDGSLIFTGSVYPSSMSKITIASGKNLTYKGPLFPASVFAPNVVGTGTLVMDGATLFTTSVISSDLNIGSQGSAMSVGPNGFTLNADLPITLYGTLSGSGPLTKTGISTLVLDNIGASYTGSISIHQGSLSLNNNYLNNSNIAIDNGTLILDFSSDKVHTKTLSGTSSATIIKRGSGTFIVDGDQGSMNAYDGQLIIEKGRVQLRNTSLSSHSSVMIRPMASLDLRTKGSLETTMTLPVVSMKNKGLLRIIIEGGEGLSKSKQCSIATLYGENSSTLMLQFDPALGSPLTPPLGSAPLVLRTLSTANANNDRINLQISPINKQELRDGDVFALIQANGDTSTLEMVSRLRLLSSIMFSSSNVLSVSSDPLPTKRYGNLFFDDNVLYMKVTSAGTYSKPVPGDPSVTNIPSGAYLSKSLVGAALSTGNLPWYSPLDRMLGSLLDDPHSLVHTLTPKALEQPHFSLHSLENQCRDNPWAHLESASFTTPSLQSSLAQELLPYKTQGPWTHWDYALQEPKGHLYGAALHIGGNSVVGLQAMTLQAEQRHNLKDASSSALTSQTTTLQGYMRIGSYRSLATSSRQILMQQRMLSDEGAQDRWIAQSQQSSQELSVDQAVGRSYPLSPGLSIHTSLGHKLQYQSYQGYTEQGDSNLNLVVSPYATWSQIISPQLTIEASLPSLSLQGCMSYHCTQLYHGPKNFAFKECDLGEFEIQSFTENPSNMSARVSVLWSSALGLAARFLLEGSCPLASSTENSFRAEGALFCQW